jgi:hypothetical protein
VAAYCGLIYETSPEPGIYDGIVGIFNKSKFDIFLYLLFFWFLLAVVEKHF